MHESSRRLVRLVCLALVSGCATSSDGTTSVVAGVGQPIPELRVKDFDGKAVDAGLIKGQVVLLDIWASWCAPCKEELPLLDSMAGRLRHKGVTILAVSIDENRDDAAGFLKSRREHWSLALAHDSDGRLADRLKPTKMPTSYVIDRAGIIRQVNSGFERQDVAKIEARLTEMAGQP
jgi:thiol-disulfide isomerase/thioredoxin